MSNALKQDIRRRAARDSPSCEDEWPGHRLERVTKCPLCGSGDRTALYEGLVDRVFFCAPGKWTYWRCSQCQCAYLDPRPDEESIGQAYSDYYTHSAPVMGAKKSPNLLRMLQTGAANDYLNSCFGYGLRPCFYGGRWLLNSERRTEAERSIRHLRLSKSGNRLLDLGCGNGAFLERMEQAGWAAKGLEPDAKAVAAAQSAGLNVRQGFLADDSFPGNHFDAVTLNHVIEHLHSPRETLERCFRILKPEGVLWIATPNLDSIGHLVYGCDWIGLDAPRHLVLFTPSALINALKLAGFGEVSSPKITSAARWYFRASAAVSSGRDPIRSRSPHGWEGLRLHNNARRANLMTRSNPSVGEEIILLARKLS